MARQAAPAAAVAAAAGGLAGFIHNTRHSQKGRGFHGVFKFKFKFKFKFSVNKGV